MIESLRGRKRAAVGEPRLLIRRIMEMSQVRKSELTAANQSDGVKTEGRGAAGRGGRIRRGPCHCIAPANCFTSIQRFLERSCKGVRVLWRDGDLGGSRNVSAC